MIFDRHEYLDGIMEFRWNPNKSQRDLFEEWKKYTVNYLVACREGCNVRSIPTYMEENVGEYIPLQKMGFFSIHHFLYAMEECIEIRKLDYKLFVFIRESAVPSNLAHLRQMVLGQAKDKSCKTKTGVIKRPTKNQSLYCRPEELLSGTYRPPTASINNSFSGSQSNNFSRPQQSNYQQQKPLSHNLHSRPGYRTTQSIQSPKLQSSSSRPPTSIPPKATSNGYFRGNVNGTTSASATNKSVPTCSNAKPDENSWDDWSTPAPAASTSKSVFVAASAPPCGAPPSIKSQGPARYRKLAGLVDDDDDFEDYSDDSEIFDYYSGPTLSSKSRVVKMAEGFNVSVVDPITVTVSSETTTSTMKSAVSNTRTSTSSKPADLTTGISSSSSENLTTDTITSAHLSSVVADTVITTVTSAAIKTPSVSGSIVVATPPIINGSHSLARPPNSKPLRGLNVDSENVLFQYQNMYPEDKHAAARIMLDIPKIKLPKFFYIGSKTNLSLKAYLTSMS